MYGYVRKVNSNHLSKVTALRYRDYQAGKDFVCFVISKSKAHGYDQKKGSVYSTLASGHVQWHTHRIQLLSEARPRKAPINTLKAVLKDQHGCSRSAE